MWSLPVMYICLLFLILPGQPAWHVDITHLFSSDWCLVQNHINSVIDATTKLVPKICIIWASFWENRIFAHAKTKQQISCAVTAQLISDLVFAAWIVRSLFFLNSKFQASCHLLWLHRLVCVRPGGKPRRPVFSEQGSYKPQYEKASFFICINKDLDELQLLHSWSVPLFSLHK